MNYAVMFSHIAIVAAIMAGAALIWLLVLCLYTKLSNNLENYGKNKTIIRCLVIAFIIFVSVAAGSAITAQFF
ncbi:MAG: hypothetical protein FWH03_02670 [Firmicutes bacterium]|nr:hypothetical protein [Bacillota bacterium]